MNRLLHILLLSFLLNASIWGQRIIPTPGELYSDAIEFMYSGDYYEALDILLSLNSRGFATANINYLIGECYLNTREYKTQSIPFLKQATGQVSVNYTGKTIEEEFAPVKSLLYLGIAYRLDYDFENALHYFNEYLKNIDDSDKENARAAEYHMERCNYAREMMAAPTKIIADTLTVGMNTGRSFFNPLVTADEGSLIYMDQLKFYDAVMYSAKKDSIWMDSQNLTPEIGSDGDHYATGISSDGKTLLFTFYEPYRSGEIYAADFRNDAWNHMYKLSDKINTLFNETHASLSPDGKVLYFTSDRKGGYGGTDIYRSVKNERDEWEKPQNLGPLLNTPYNEESPFVSSDGSKLYFSSQGHYNMGGFDVFFSEKDIEGNWLPPVNVGYPLNTTDDDLFFFPVSGNAGYQSRFSNNSPEFELVRYKILSIGRPARFMVNGKIDITADPGFNPSSISVSFIETNAGDTLPVKPLNEDGSFRQKLSAGNYRIDFSDHSKSLLSSSLEIPDYFPHNNLLFHESISLPSVITNDTVRIRTILFEFNNSKPADEYKGEIESVISILGKYPDAVVKINGYTDAIGSEKFNMKLALERANSIKQVLENRAEKTLRILTVSHGESDPVALNRNHDGTDNPEGRHYNRRVEIQFEGLPETIQIIRVDEVPGNLKLN